MATRPCPPGQGLPMHGSRKAGACCPPAAGQPGGAQGWPAVGRAAPLVPSISTLAPWAGRCPIWSQCPDHGQPSWPQCWWGPHILLPLCPLTKEDITLATGMAAEVAFSILFKKKEKTKSFLEDNRRRSRAEVLGTVTCPYLAPGLPRQGRGRARGEKGQMLLQMDTVAKGAKSRELNAADPISRTTSLEAFLWPRPFGVHFSGSKGTVR